MLLVLLKLTDPSISRRLRGGGLISMTSVQPKGIVTLLPATGTPPVLFDLCAQQTHVRMEAQRRR